MKRVKSLRRIVVGLLCCIPLAVIVFVVGGIIEISTLLVVGLCLFGLIIILLAIIWVISIALNRRIDSYCSKCNQPSLCFKGSKVERTGKFKNYWSSGYYSHEILEKTKYYKCSNCGHEKSSSITYPSEESFPYRG